MTSKSYLKERDAWITVLLVDVFAVPIAKLSSRFFKFLIPDHFTFFALYSFALGLFVLFNFDPYFAFFLFFMSSVFDCVDGKLARLNGFYTSHGKVVDALGDFIVHSFGFLLIAFWFFTNGELISTSIVLVWSVLFGIAHISSIVKTTDDSNKRSLGSNGMWDRFCKKHRLIKRPISEVEIAFFFIPVSVCFVDYSSVMLIISTIAYALFKLSMRK